MSRLCLAASAAMALALVAPASSQPFQLTDDATLELSGGIQPRASLGVDDADGTTRLGFGLRRARLQFRLTLLDRFGMEYDLDTTPGDVRSVDLFAFADLSDGVQLRAGRLPPAQPRGFNPTSNTRIDAVDRAAITGLWAAGTLGSAGRDLALDLTADLGDTDLQLSLHNGTGGFSRELDNFRESGYGSSPTRGVDRTDLALSGSVHHGKPTGLSFGGFASGNTGGSARTALNDVERGYATAGAHLYWGDRPGAQPFRAKLDVVATQYQAVDGVRERQAGAAVLGAVRAVPHSELFARGERYWDDVDRPGDTFGTVGASYSPSAALGRDYRDIRITAAYVVRRAAEGDLGHLAILQGQVIF